MSFQYGDEPVEFELEARPQVDDRVLIKVYPNCRVVVAAPESAGEDEVLCAVKKRGRWIYQQLKEFRAHQEYLSPRRYVSGESHHYLGRRYLLKVSEQPDLPPSLKLFRGKLEVSVRRKDAERVREALLAWYKARAREIFAARLDALMERALWVVERPSIRVLSMRTQWGSCSPNGCLTLNPHLVKAPRECIDYVILHELCHIAEHNHSERFYRLMSQTEPRWRDIKLRLDGLAHAILAD